MNKVLLAATLAASLIAPSAFAQSLSAYAKKFEGFSVYGTLNASSSQYKENGPGYSASVSDSDANGTLGAQYDWALGDNFVLGLGVDAGLSSLKSGSVLGADAGLYDMYSLYLAPGVSLSDSVLLYGKLGTANARVKYSGASSGSQDISGLAYGLGVRMYYDRNVYFNLEYQQFHYDDKHVGNITLGEQSNQFSVGVGYRF